MGSSLIPEVPEIFNNVKNVIKCACTFSTLDLKMCIVHFEVWEKKCTRTFFLDT